VSRLQRSRSDPPYFVICHLQFAIRHSSMPKIVRFHQVGDASVLKLEELPKPQPKEGEVLLKVEAIALNRAEVMFRSGQYLYQPSFPSLLGYGKGFALAFDPVAGPGLETLAKAAGKGAMIIEYGALAPEPTPYPLFAAIEKGLNIRGYTLFEINTDPERQGRAKEFIIEKLADGTFRPIIAKTFKLDQIVEAHRYMESNEQIGKIVVTV